jgi:hypothetical protein
VKAGVIFSAAGSGEFFEETVSPSNWVAMELCFHDDAGELCNLLVYWERNLWNVMQTYQV